MDKKVVKSLFTDVMLNTIAFAILTGTQQLLAYPIIASKMSPEVFGDFLTFMAISNILSAIIGTELGNTRLILNSKYKEKSYKGDFKLILGIGVIVNFIIMVIMSFLLNDIEFVLGDKIIMAVMGTLPAIRLYLMAEYRVESDFKKILFQNIFYVIGIVIGIGVFCVSGKIYSVFLIAELISVAYSYRGSKIYSEKFNYTPMIKETMRLYKNMGITTGISYATNQLDKLLINPILGSRDVSIYHSAGVVAKMGSIVLNPINGVILSWLGRLKINKKKVYFYTVTGSLLVGIVYWIGSITLSPIFIKILYPQYYMNSKKIYVGICLASAISVSIGFIKLAIMRFGNAEKLVKIYGSYSTIYVIGCLVLVYFNGLKGFISANIYTRILLLVMVLRQMSKEVKNNI